LDYKILNHSQGKKLPDVLLAATGYYGCYNLYKGLPSNRFLGKGGYTAGLFL